MPKIGKNVKNSAILKKRETPKKPKICIKS